MGQPASGQQASSGRVACLLIEEAVVQWIGESAAGGIPLPSREVGDLAKAFAEVRRHVAARRSRFLILLREGICTTRSLVLPPLSRADRQAVLSRKAAEALGCDPRCAAWTAVLLRQGGREGGETSSTGQEEWLLSSVRIKELLDLRSAARRAGLRIAALAPEILARARAFPPVVEGPWILLDQGPGRSVLLALCQGEQLVWIASPKLAGIPPEEAVPALIHEVRSLDLLWRRRTRGDGVPAIRFSGFEGESLKLLRLALDINLPWMAEIPQQDSSPAPAAEGLPAWTASLVAAAHLAPRLHVAWPLPVHRIGLRAGATGAAGLLLLLGASELLASSARERCEDLEKEAGALESRAALRDRLVEERAAQEALVRSVGQEIQRNLRIRRWGIDAPRIVAALRSALRGRAEVTGLSIGRTGSGPEEILVRLRMLSDPPAVASLLRSFRKGIASDPDLHFVGVDLPGNLEKADQSGEFELTLRLEHTGSLQVVSDSEEGLPPEDSP